MGGDKDLVAEPGGDESEELKGEGERWVINFSRGLGQEVADKEGKRAWKGETEEAIGGGNQGRGS